MKKLLAFALVCATTVPAALAASPWDGTWKLDRSKSHLTGTTFKYSKAANGMWRYDDGSTPYDFATDGKARPTWAPDAMGTFTMDGDHAINMVFDTKGQKMSIHEELSADGKTLTDHATGTRPDGSKIDNTVISTRVGAGTGFMGTWKSTKDNSTASGTYKISTSAGNKIKWEIPEQKAIVEGTMDGSDIKASGVGMPDGMLLTIKPAGPSTLHYTVKMGAKVVNMGTLTLSADGKTLTDTSWVPAKPAEKTIGVYDKQ